MQGIELTAYLSFTPLNKIFSSSIKSKPYLSYTPLNKILSFLSASELKAYLSYLLLSQIVSLLAPIESNFMFLYPPVIQILNFLKDFLRCNSRLYSFGEMPKRICISRQKCILIKVKINIKRIHELNFNPILFHLKVVPYGQTKIRNLCKRKEQNPYKFHFCYKRKYIQLDFKISQTNIGISMRDERHVTIFLQCSKRN